MITGVGASAEYIRRYGSENEDDVELARLLAEEMVEFDPETEIIKITERGRIALWESETGTLAEWQGMVAN